MVTEPADKVFTWQAGARYLVQIPAFQTFFL